jgi:putative hydrolase of the HAD superfamily
MIVKGIIFNIDNVLYDTRFQKDAARISAIRAMVEGGLPIDFENGFHILNEVVEEYGVDSQKHFDEMLKRLGINWKPRVIAAGVVAYRETSRAYLTPYPDTIPTIIELRDKGLNLGVVSSGNPVKQWQKLIKLGVQHLFHAVMLAAEHGKDQVDESLFNTILNNLNLKSENCIFVGSNFNDIKTANEMGILTTRVRRGSSSSEEPPNQEMAAARELKSLRELIALVEEIREAKPA